MNIYILQPVGELLAAPHNPIGEVLPIPVIGSDWHGARASAIRVATRHGEPTLGIMVNGVSLFRRPRKQPVAPQHANDSNGMIMYMARLAVRFGHVYVPPLAWEPHHPQCGRFLVPSIPLVSAYQTKALQEVADIDDPLGFQLCCAGYDSYTVGDYFYHYQASGGKRHTLEDVGTAVSWRTAYINHISTVLA
jgi:hypothetical protein